jgi:hypothetical protein
MLHMAGNFELPNDSVWTFPIVTMTALGTFEPVPAGDVPTVTSSNPVSMTAVASAAAPWTCTVTPLVQLSPGLTVTVADSAGLAPNTYTIDIVADVTPTNVGLDMTAGTHVAQPVPAAPGP